MPSIDSLKGRIWPLQIERDRDTKNALNHIDKLIDKSCNGNLTPEVYETASDPEYYQLCEYMTIGNRSLNCDYNERVSEPGVILGDACVHQAWHLYRWRRNGSHIYDIGLGISRAFLDTELRISGNDVQVPFPTFYLAVDKDLGLKVWNNSSGWHELDGFFISQSRLFEESDVQEDGSLRSVKTFTINGKKTSMSIQQGPEFRRVLSVLAIGRCREGEEIHDNALSMFPLPLACEDYEKYISELDDNLKYIRGMAANFDQLRSWHRLIVNTLLYLSSPEPDSVVGNKLYKSDALKKKARDGTRADRMAFAKSIIPVSYFSIGANFKASSDDAEKYASADKETREMTRRFMVRGHWRNQPHGQKLQQKKLIWIKPHFKGPSWAEVASAHVTKVK